MDPGPCQAGLELLPTWTSWWWQSPLGILGMGQDGLPWAWLGALGHRVQHLPPPWVAGPGSSRLLLAGGGGLAGVLSWSESPPQPRPRVVVCVMGTGRLQLPLVCTGAVAGLGPKPAGPCPSPALVCRGSCVPVPGLAEATGCREGHGESPEGPVAAGASALAGGPCARVPGWAVSRGPWVAAAD